MSRAIISARDARRLLLHRQGLGTIPTALAGGHGAQQRALLELVERLGFVQVDSIRSVERAHHMILFARNPRYQPRHLQALLERERVLFENWTHDASIIPTRFWPYWQHRFERERARLRARWRKNRPQGMGDTQATLARVRDNGEVRSRDMSPGSDREQGAPKSAQKSDGWWDWHPSKAALEYLWRTGELAVARREGFQKVYDLSDRVIPAQWRAGAPEDVVDWAMNAALDRLGVASSAELAAFFELVTPNEARRWCEQYAAHGLVEVEVQSADGSRPRTALARPQLLDELAQLPPPPARIRILSPFDPVLRDRARMQRLFNFDYRIEIYVPAAKRRYGYYVFPVLEGDRLVARIDMHCDREDKALHVRALWWESGVRPSKARQQKLESELQRWRRFTGMSSVRFADHWQQGNAS